jgi:hypothetical protein
MKQKLKATSQKTDEQYKEKSLKEGLLTKGT